MNQHLESCAGFLTLYLDVKSSETKIHYFDLLIPISDSIYTDSDGEKDLMLRRGAPLFLCQQSLEELRDEFISHNILCRIKHYLR